MPYFFIELFFIYTPTPKPISFRRNSSSFDSLVSHLKVDKNINLCTSCIYDVHIAAAVAGDDDDKNKKKEQLGFFATTCVVVVAVFAIHSIAPHMYTIHSSSVQSVYVNYA